MTLRRLYYDLKPFVPWPLRMAARRWVARHKRATCDGLWPIKPGSEAAPPDWPGWPNGKRFAFVLTHDVEGPEGLARCRALMDIENRCGFRSSFNFIPEGDYAVSRELREELAREGFEVGVHDLHHDGKLYRDRRQFARKAHCINRYLKEWGAVGFRSGFMHHNLDWLQDLDIQYDSSTFDTDPFEPQPDGVHTIFPFRVTSPTGSTYIELPYTLPQDFCVYVLLREQGIGIWKQKLDWIAAHGGMALLDTHPDYMSFDGKPPRRHEYPAEWYDELLRYARARHGDTLWPALPREVATYVAHHLPATAREVTACVAPARPKEVSRQAGVRSRIWIDLDNTPHVPFFDPVIRELDRRGYDVLITARDAFQVRGLLARHRLNAPLIGRHYGRSRLRKLFGLGWRALQLLPIAMARRPHLAVSHGARSQILLSGLLRIPTVLIDDYEYSSYPPGTRPDWFIVPQAIPAEALPVRRDRVLHYCGMKEDVYVGDFTPDGGIRVELGLADTDVVVTVRPPADEAHYHHAESSALFEAVMEHLCATPNLRTILLPRNARQERSLRHSRPAWFADRRVIVPETAVDGLNLVWHSDLVISAGGTMNREAAALGVPVYSIFRGPIAAVDRQLQRQGRLVLIESVDEVRSRIPLRRRARPCHFLPPPSLACGQIVEHLERILALRQAADLGRVGRFATLTPAHSHPMGEGIPTCAEPSAGGRRTGESDN